MNSYNGFSPDQRMKAYRWLQDQIRSGKRLPPQGKCHCCGTEAYTEHHSEDYSEPYGDHIGKYDICYRCHMWIHCRFRNHKGFRQYVTYIRDGMCFTPFNGKDWYRFRRELETMPVPYHGGTPVPHVPLLDDLVHKLGLSEVHTFNQ